MNGLSSQGEQLISAAYVFGASAFAFAVLPFGFVMLKAFMDSKKPDVLPSSIFGVFLIAFGIHFVSCVGFFTLIKVLDSQASIYGTNYWQEKVFPLFWTDGKDAILAASGAGDNIVAESAVSILILVQEIRYWSFLIMPVMVLILGVAYGLLQAKKDTYKQNGDWLSVAVWSMVSFAAASFLFILWAKIASIAMFIPAGEGDLLSKIQEAYLKLISGGK